MSGSPLKIKLLVTNDISQDQRMHRIATSLCDIGLDVELIGRQKKNSLPLKKRKYNTKRLKLPFHKGILFYLSYNLAAFSYLWTNKPDLVYAVDLDSLLAARTIKQLRPETHLIFDAHEHFTEVPELKNSPLKKKIWEAVAKWSIPRVDLCLTVGPALAEIFSDQYDRSFHAIRNTPIINHGPEVEYQAENKVLLYQGMLNEGRGLEVLVDTMEKLQDWTLWLVGSGDIAQTLKEHAKKSKASDRIVFHGFVEPDELPAFTRQATLGLNLLVAESLSYYYSLANKTFDYMACGVPAIHMDFPEYREIQEKYHCFLLLDKLEKRSLVKLIHQTDSPQLLRLHQNNLEAAQHFQWKLESKKLKKLFQHLLTEKQQLP